MPTRDEVRRRLAAGEDYAAVGEALGIPAGQVYLIGTGVPADGSDSLGPDDYERPGLLLGGSQALLGVPHHNPTVRARVGDFVQGRVQADAQMRAAAERSSS